MNNENTRKRIAWFISPHGYGHAARSSAIMQSIINFNPQFHFEIFTTVPEWFFEKSLSRDWYSYHSVSTDVGLVQTSPIDIDFKATIQQLSQLYPLQNHFVDKLAAEVVKAECMITVSDIAPIGIAVAQKAGLPSVLIENFTWDWIYKAYKTAEPKFSFYIEYLGRLFTDADQHIQTEPICLEIAETVKINPVSRLPRHSRDITLRKLNIPLDSKMLLISMGGVPTRHTFVEKLKMCRDVYFVIPHDVPKVDFFDNIRLLPHHSDFYHPDLVHASDAVVGKLGYSTVAEAYSAGVAYGFIDRPGFLESEILANFVKEKLPALNIDQQSFLEGNWCMQAEELVSCSRGKNDSKNGAKWAAKTILNTLGSIL